MYSKSSGTSFAILSILSALSEFAGPVPVPVVPNLVLGYSALSFTIWSLLIIPHVESTKTRSCASKFLISSNKICGLINTPGPSRSLVEPFKAALGSIRTLYVFPFKTKVCPALGPTPPRAAIMGLYCLARYAIIFPFPSSPKNPPTTTTHGIGKCLMCGYLRLVRNYLLLLR
jgi:hypothetical protein